jgi:hypothetical protein
MKASLKLTIWYFLFASLIATFSTMAILAWLGASAVQLLTTSGLTLKFRVPKLRINPSSLVTLLVAIIGIVAIESSSQGERITEMVKLRTVDRVMEGERGYLEDFNVGITDFLLDQPIFTITGVGLGNVHLYATEYLPVEVQSYAAGTPFVAKSFFLKWLSELGLLSFLVFCYWVVATLRKAASLERRVPKLGVAKGCIAKFGLPLFAFILASSYATPQFFMMLGSALAICAAGRREIRLVKAKHTAQVRARAFNTPITGNGRPVQG